jgi:tetratricopeptide (TPR) repeat protein
MTIHSRILPLALVIAAIAIAPSPVAAAPEHDAKVHIERAAAAHKAGDFETALAELQAAHKLRPDPAHLYAIGQVLAKLGRCDQAIAFYERFLATLKDRRKRAIVKQAITACQRESPVTSPRAIASDPPPADGSAFATRKPEVEHVEDDPAPLSPLDPDPAPPPGPARAPSPPPMPIEPIATADAAPSARPWYKDPLGGVLVASGVAAGVGAFVFYRSALSDLDAAESASSLARYEELVDRAHGSRRSSALLLGGGVVLAGAGIVRYALRGSPREPGGMAMAPAPGGMLVTWSGGF